MSVEILDLEGLRARVRAGESLDYTLFYGHTEQGPSVTAACFSQWYPARFELGGIGYESAEQYMMAGKARLFDDPEVLAAILGTPDPGLAKGLGRKVRGFEGPVWNATRLEIVVAGNVAKFGQNPACKRVLMATGDAVLVEAAPRDRIWGIGMGRDNPDAHSPLAWRGQNLLGFALMAARSILADL